MYNDLKTSHGISKIPAGDIHVSTKFHGQLNAFEKFHGNLTTKHITSRWCRLKNQGVVEW